MATNEEIVREVYAAAEGAHLDTDKFVSLFHEDGYFLDESSEMKWVGSEVRQPVAGLFRAFPDVHRELLRFYVTGDVVIVELKIQGTHLGDLQTAGGVLSPTGKKADIPCCDVFHIRD
jgi:ketosteroid isomerase-like protein